LHTVHVIHLMLHHLNISKVEFLLSVIFVFAFNKHHTKQSCISRANVLFTTASQFLVKSKKQHSIVTKGYYLSPI
jgi:hypothetical protein